MPFRMTREEELLCWKNVNSAIRFELNNAVPLCIKRKVIALPHKKSRAEFAAPLAYNNTAGAHFLAAINFDAEPFWIRVAAVCCTSL